ncbi:MAG: alpha/beta fold hydrolase [Fimbriiglobus sp.]
MTTLRSVAATQAGELAKALEAYDTQARHGVWQSPRYRLAYTDWGEVGAPVVVLVHGMADEVRSFAMLMQQLTAQGFRCLAYELADGRDGANLRSYSHADFATDLLEWLAHLELKDVHILGCSFGSTVTLQAVHREPARFRKVALQGGFARRPLNSVEKALVQLAHWLPGTFGGLPMRRSMMAKMDQPQLVDCPPEIFEFLIECGGKTPCKAAGHRSRLLGRADLRPLLKDITLPLLMITGERDTVVENRWSEEVVAGVTNGHEVRLATTGHYPQYSCPTTLATILAEHFR